MPKAARPHRIARSIPAPQHPVIRLLPRPAAPDAKCQSVANGLNVIKNEALHGVYDGVLVLCVQPDGNAIWEAHGSAADRSETTKAWAAKLASAIFRDLS